MPPHPRGTRTAMNAVEIEQAISELALRPFDATGFPHAFVAALGNRDTARERLRAGNNNASDVPGGHIERDAGNTHGHSCRGSLHECPTGCWRMARGYVRLRWRAANSDWAAALAASNSGTRSAGNLRKTGMRAGK